MWLQVSKALKCLILIKTTFLEYSFVKHNCGSLGVKSLWSNSIVKNIIKIT